MVSATGATVHMHYCMGKFMGAAFSHDDDEMCGKCGMTKENNKGCCKDIHKTIKTSDHQFTKASFDFSHQQVVAILPYNYNFYQAEALASRYTVNVARAHAPPSLWRTYPIYIQVRNFRI